MYNSLSLSLATKLCPTLATPWTVAHQAPLSQARILEWVAIFFSRGFSQSRNWMGLLPYRQILDHLSHQGSPNINWVLTIGQKECLELSWWNTFILFFMIILCGRETCDSIFPSSVSRYNWHTALFTFKVYSIMPQRRQWPPHSSTLAWKSHGWRSLVGCSPWGR